MKFQEGTADFYVAQFEHETTSERTKAALAVLKDKGIPLGTSENMTHKAQKLGGKVTRENAKTHKNNLQALELINDKLKSGWTYQAIADRLNKLEYKTSLGNSFKVITVRKLLQRSEGW